VIIGIRDAKRGCPQESRRITQRARLVAAQR
jgi:hypothetical protein